MLETHKSNQYVAPEVIPKLSFDDKESMLQHIIRIPSLFLEAKRQIDIKYFTTTEIRYACLWKAATQLAEKSGGRIPENGACRRLESEIRSMLETDSALLSMQEFDDLVNPNSGLVKWIYDTELSDLYEADGRTLLLAFLNERIIVEPLKRFVSDTGDFTPVNLQKVLKSINEQRLKIETVKKNPIQIAFPNEWKPKKLDLTTTGVPFLDKFMGGQAAGEAYGILGPSGTGKTLLSVMIAVNGARYEQMTAKSEKEMGHWYYFTYESAVDPEIITRVLSYAAEIHRDSLLFNDDLSTSDNLKTYEKERWAEQLKAGIPVHGEKERLAAIAPMLRKNLWLCDMSGSDPENPYAGTGYVDEIADYLAIEVDNGHRISGVVVDYVGIAATRHMEANNIKYDQLRHYVGKFGDKARRTIAAQFQCPVWLIHQFTGEATKRAPTATMHHADAAEAKDFAHNLWYCFNLHNKQKEHNVTMISCSKERRSHSAGITPLVKIDGAFCNMYSVDHLFSIEGNQIQPKGFLNKIDNSKSSKVSSKPNPAMYSGF